MKWGVRQQERLNMSKRVASGKGSFEDKVRVAAAQNPISLVRGGGLKGAAKLQAKDLENLKTRMDLGRTTASDYFNRFGTIKLNHIGGTGARSTRLAEAKGTIKRGEFTTQSKIKVARNLTIGMLGAIAVGRGIGKVIASLPVP